MLRALDRNPHARRLNELMARFRAQEATMVDLLHDLQTELEFWQREAHILRTTSHAETGRVLDRCRDLQIECDLLATELVHVRMAVAGTGDELDECRQARPRTGDSRAERLPA